VSFALLPVVAAHLGSLLIAGRVAIVVSAAAADGQTPLRYAERDADRVATVLRELGGFARVNQLRDPSPSALRAALTETEALAARDPGLEVVFYYSGHADTQGLLMGSARFPFDELRSRLEQSRAAVRVALLDACYSGSIVRPKGGKPTPGYALDTVEPPRVHGAAIIAAGTASELAQESGDIEGSYFTHHVLSALRGAGDRDGNGVVTLAEAYQYAYSHTLAATLPSVWGPQHPSYEYQLSGTGDLVITRIGRDRQALSFPPGQGRVYVVSTAADEVMAEVAAQPQSRVRIVLPSGRYHVVAREGRRAWLADVTLRPEPGIDAAVEGASFREVAPELAFAKGMRLAPQHEVTIDVAMSGLGPGAIGGAPELGFGYFRRLATFTVGPHVSYGATDGSVFGVPYALRRWTVTAFGLRRFPFGVTDLHLGLGIGVAAIEERLGGAPTRSGLAPAASVAVAVDLPLWRWLALRFLWSGGAQLIRGPGELSVTPEVRASLGAVFRK
jgi:Caspase domain